MVSVADKDAFGGGLQRVGGELSLDFTNTVSWHGSPQAEEWLTSYSHLVAWAHLAGVLTDKEQAALLKQATRRPAEAAGVLEEALRLREALFRIYTAVRRADRPDSADLATLNRLLTRAYAHLEIEPGTDAFTWRWTGGSQELDRPLWSVARSAAELLASDRLGRVKECAGEHCGWLFLDRSRNQSRRWCDMGDCGNREKARRHYQRLREQLEKERRDSQ
jgi:predicted RNA-binding Zn ribbon-like protein